MPSESRPTLLFLHGWSGSKNFWDPLLAALPKSYLCRAWNLPGHAGERTPSARNLKNPEAAADWLVRQIEAEFSQSGSLVLVGYSLGGRLAALIAARLKRPKLAGLALFSAGLGAIPGDGTEKRHAWDQAWIKLLRANPREFWQKWYRLEIFSDLTGAEVDGLAESKKIHDIEALADAFEKFSPALHGELLPGLQGLQHLLYFAGERDKKYCEIARQIEAACPRARVVLVPQAGHMAPRQNPSFCAEKLATWLEEMEP